MDVRNTILSTPLVRTAQEERQARGETAQRNEVPTRPPASASVEIDGEALQKRGEALESQRVERLNALDSAPLQTRKAIESYQQSTDLDASASGGELVGVDLFV